MIHERRLGRTGLSVSEIGYGAWGVGGSMWLGGTDAGSFGAADIPFPETRAYVGKVLDARENYRHEYKRELGL